MTNISGLSSGGSAGNIAGQLDVQWIVEQLIYAKQQPIRDLEVFETFYEAKKESFQELNTRVSSLESALYKMNNSSFDSKSATVSSEANFTASANSTASDGEYTIWVDQLAAAQSATTNGFASPDDQLLTGGGTITIKNFDNSETLGEITYTTTSLNGLRDSINALGLDHSATVINFGTKSSPNYKLQITADNTGTENGFNITYAGAGVDPNFLTKVAAADAQVYVNVNPATNPGEFITRSSNSISDIIGGVTLNLKNADATSATTLTIETDTAGLKENIQEFVSQFNSTMDFLNGHFTYDEQKQRAGVLSGEAGALKVKNDLLLIASSRVEGLTGSDKYNSFSVIGVEINQLGQLEINDAKLDSAIEDHLGDVKRILKDVGTSTHADSRYVGHSDSTVAGTYAIHVDSVAEQAEVKGADVIAATLGQAENLTITYGGKNYSVALASGLSDLDVVETLNSALDDKNVSVYSQIDTSTGKLEFLTYDYGAGQTVKVISDVASGAGGTGIGTTLIDDTGVDVAGTIDGVAASGSGRILTSLSGSSKGLQVNISTTSLNDAINGDDKGSITFTRGVGEKLRDRMYEISFPYSGMLSKNIEALENKLNVITDDIANINRRLASEQEILIMQFTKANEAMSQMAYLQSTLSNNFK